MKPTIKQIHPCLFILAFATLFLALAGRARADSLWAQKHPDDKEALWTDRRALHVGDIVTIIIQEESQATQSEEFNRDRQTNASASLGFNLGPAGSNSGDLSFDSRREIDTNREDTTEKTFTTRLAAIVKEKLFNGNLLIEATREMIVQDEVTTIIISGIIRPDDIRADNTILSENIAEAQIRYEGKGHIGDVRKRGRFGQKILDFVIPF